MMSMGIKPGRKILHTCKNGEKHEILVRNDWPIDPTGSESVQGLYVVKDYLDRKMEAY